jgi:hypothetical protein
LTGLSDRERQSADRNAFERRSKANSAESGGYGKTALFMKKDSIDAESESAGLRCGTSAMNLIIKIMQVEAYMARSQRPNH